MALTFEAYPHPIGWVTDAAVLVAAGTAADVAAAPEASAAAGYAAAAAAAGPARE